MKMDCPHCHKTISINFSGYATYCFEAFCVIFSLGLALLVKKVIYHDPKIPAYNTNTFCPECSEPIDLFSDYTHYTKLEAFNFRFRNAILFSYFATVLFVLDFVFLIVGMLNFGNFYSLEILLIFLAVLVSCIITLVIIATKYNKNHNMFSHTGETLGKIARYVSIYKKEILRSYGFVALIILIILTVGLFMVATGITGISIVTVGFCLSICLEAVTIKKEFLFFRLLYDKIIVYPKARTIDSFNKSTKDLEEENKPFIIMTVVLTAFSVLALLFIIICLNLVPHNAGDEPEFVSSIVLISLAGLSYIGGVVYKVNCGSTTYIGALSGCSTLFCLLSLIFVIDATGANDPLAVFTVVFLSVLVLLSVLFFVYTLIPHKIKAIFKQKPKSIKEQVQPVTPPVELETADKLERFFDLKQKGAISDEEYTEIKKQILQKNEEKPKKVTEASKPKSANNYISEINDYINKLSEQCPSIVWHQIKEPIISLLKKDKNETVEYFKSENADIQSWTLSAITNTAANLLSTGRYNIYPGLLNFEGEALFKIYKFTTEQMVKRELVTQEAVDENISVLLDNLNNL